MAIRYKRTPTKNHKAAIKTESGFLFDSSPGGIPYGKVTRTVNRDDNFNVFITTEIGSSAPQISVFLGEKCFALTKRQFRTIERAFKKHNNT